MGSGGSRDSTSGSLACGTTPDSTFGVPTGHTGEVAVALPYVSHGIGGPHRGGALPLRRFRLQVGLEGRMVVAGPAGKGGQRHLNGLSGQIKCSYIEHEGKRGPSEIFSVFITLSASREFHMLAKLFVRVKVD